MESYRELRIDDLMGKYAFQIIEQAIDSTGKLPRGYVDFTRGQPCLTYRWALDGKHPQTPKEWDATPHYGLQIQAQSLRAFFHLNPQQHDFVDANSAQKSIKEEYNGILLSYSGCYGSGEQCQTLQQLPLIPDAGRFRFLLSANQIGKCT